MMTRQCPECSRVFEDEDTLFDHLLDTHGYSMDEAEDAFESKAKEFGGGTGKFDWESEYFSIISVHWEGIEGLEKLAEFGNRIERLQEKITSDRHRLGAGPYQRLPELDEISEEDLRFLEEAEFKLDDIEEKLWDKYHRINNESYAIEKWTDDELGRGYWDNLLEQDRIPHDDDGYGKISHLSWDQLPEQFKIGMVEAIRDDEYFTESHAIEVSSEEEEVGSDLWQALAEGNLLGDYVFGGIFNFEITMPEWATDPQIDVGSIGWFELSDADKQNVVNHFGGVDGMKEKLCDEGWGSYCDEIESYESKAREDKLDKAQLDIDDEEEFMKQVDIAQKSDDQNPLFDMEALQKKYSMCNSCMDKAFKSLTNESQMADAMYSQWRGTAIGDERNYENWETFALVNGVSQQEAIDTWEKLNPSYGFESKRF